MIWTSYFTHSLFHTTRGTQIWGLPSCDYALSLFIVQNYPNKRRPRMARFYRQHIAVDFWLVLFLVKLILTLFFGLCKLVIFNQLSFCCWSEVPQHVEFERSHGFSCAHGSISVPGKCRNVLNEKFIFKNYLHGDCLIICYSEERGNDSSVAAG